MNHIKLLASFAIVRCRRFIAFLVFNLKELVSTQPIIRATRSLQGLQNIGSDLRFWYACYINDLTRLVRSTARALSGSERAATRIARSVAIAIGISLSMQSTAVGIGSIDRNPKEYIKAIMPKHEAICLSRLIGKESAWNPKAIGNLSSPSKSYTYGLLQLKNPIVKDKDPITQIHYGLRYINHRYQGDTCKAWKHWERKGWH